VSPAAKFVRRVRSQADSDHCERLAKFSIGSTRGWQKTTVRATNLISHGSSIGVKVLSIVPQFVIEREIPGAGTLSEIQIRDISLQSLATLKEMGPQIQWLHSYVTEDKIYCLYLAPDEDCIREHARRAGIPADRVAAVRRLIDPANLN
jgi:hypothetical protein